MSSPQTIFTSILKKAGYSVTAPRLRVFEVLQGREPVSMHELVTLVATADRASVYRAVELFESLGIIQRIHTGWKYKIELSDHFASHHHHLTCTQCEKTTPIEGSELEAVLDTLSAHYNFLPTSHQIEIQGLCGQCQAIAVQAPAHR